MAKYKKLIVIVLMIIAFASLGSWVYLQNYYAYNRQSNPQQELGRVYRLNVHGTIVYLTKGESLQQDCLFTIVILSNLSWMILNAVLKPFSTGQNGVGLR